MSELTDLQARVVRVLAEGERLLKELDELRAMEIERDELLAKRENLLEELGESLAKLAWLESLDNAERQSWQ